MPVCLLFLRYMHGKSPARGKHSLPVVCCFCATPSTRQVPLQDLVPYFDIVATGFPNLPRVCLCTAFVCLFCSSSTENGRPEARINLVNRQWSSTNVTSRLYPSRTNLLVSGVSYDIELGVTVPDSPRNRDISALMNTEGTYNFCFLTICWSIGRLSFLDGWPNLMGSNSLRYARQRNATPRRYIPTRHIGLINNNESYKQANIGRSKRTIWTRG